MEEEGDDFGIYQIKEVGTEECREKYENWAEASWKKDKGWAEARSWAEAGIKDREGPAEECGWAEV
jgi:hypothetical protein